MIEEVLFSKPFILSSLELRNEGVLEEKHIDVLIFPQKLQHLGVAFEQIERVERH